MFNLKRLIEAWFVQFLLNTRVLKKLTVALLEQPVIVYGDEEQVSIADSAFVHNAFFNVISGSVFVGENVCFGRNVCLLTGTHDYRKRDKERLLAYPKSGRDIRIESGVWIASNVTILGSVVIGKDAVVSAGSLVTGDVPSRTVYAGIPARFVKNIEFDDVGEDC